jgi:Rad3-related DNA helicase
MSDHYVVNQYRGTSTAWDIEDLVKVGKKVRACPYYGVRELKIKSHIVFCPYNYLVEPIIRKSMEISLKNNIVILDEAHNIEDSARSAASGTLQQNQIRESMADLEKMAKFYGDTMTSDPDPYFKMIGLLSKVSNWIDTAKDEGPDQSCQTFNDYGQTSKGQ